MPEPQNRTWHKNTKDDEGKQTFFYPAWRVGCMHTPEKPYFTSCKECQSFDQRIFIEECHATEKAARDWKRQHIKNNLDKEPMHLHVDIYKRVSESSVIEIDVEH